MILILEYKYSDLDDYGYPIGLSFDHVSLASNTFWTASMKRAHCENNANQYGTYKLL